MQPFGIIIIKLLLWYLQNQNKIDNANEIYLYYEVSHINSFQYLVPNGSHYKALI